MFIGQIVSGTNWEKTGKTMVKKRNILKQVRNFFLNKIMKLNMSCTDIK